MTAAPAAAPPPGPVAPPPARAASQPSADRFAFAAVLDSLPSGPAKAGDPATERQPRAPNESQREKSSGEQTAHHSPLNDSALLASLPFALRVASMMDERPQAAHNSPSLALAATKAAGSEASGASIAANAKGTSVGRLIGERAFHFGASTAGVIASPTLAIDAPLATAANLSPQAKLNGDGASALGFPQAEATLPQPVAHVVPSSDSETAPARIVPRAGSAATNRVSPARAAAHEAARSGQKPEAPAPLPAAKAASSNPVAPPVGSSADGKARSDREPDPVASTAQPAAPTDPFGALQSAGFAAGPLFEFGASTASGADAGMAPRASAAAANPAAVAQPVREIDVDLSPGGLEDVSMTMRLAGEKLSVVVRAGSSHTLNSIEGARDAIADRLAAIGQPLDSLIVKQTGLNTDGNANGNGSSADGGSSRDEQRSAQGGGSNDALSRRGAGRDRSF
jgi:hypothetical protein